MIDPPDPADTVGARYRSSRLRIESLVRSFDDGRWEQPVDACPGWRTRDVLAHLIGIVEDALAGRISGPPPPDQTRQQVERHRADPPEELLATWAVLAPSFEEALSALGRWPAFLDVLSHEHDLRTAVGDRSFRDHGDVVLAARILTASLPPGLQVVVDGQERGADGDVAACLTCSSFEILRLRMGRRSERQVLAMAWTGDPGPFLADLFVFGPAADDLDG